jgi:ribosome-binding protein aMBF1 (putative translation factor)
MNKKELRKLGIPFKDALAEQLKNPKFRKLWEAGEADYQIARQMIKARLEKKMSQRVLAKKAKTSQANISNLEGMNYNPSLAFLKRISGALGIKFQLSI